MEDRRHLERRFHGAPGLGGKDVRDRFAGGELLGAIEAGGAQGAVGQQHRLQHQPGVERVFDPDAPGAGGEDLAAHFDEILVLSLGAEERRGAVGGIALQHGTEVEVHAFMALGEGEVLLVQLQLLPAHLRERGLDLPGGRVGPLAGGSVAPEVRQRRHGDVIHPVGRFAQLQRELRQVGEFGRDAEGLGRLEVIEVGGHRGLPPMRERELDAVDLGLELALEGLGVDVAAAHLDRPGGAERGAVQFGDLATGGGLRGFFDGEFRAGQESDHRPERQDDAGPGVAAAPGLVLIGRTRELEERPGGAAVLAVRLRHEDRCHQADHRQGQGNRDADPEDPGVEGLGLAEAPAGPEQGGQKGPGKGDGRQFAQPGMPTGGDGQMKALKASQELLSGPVGADMVAVKLTAGAPRDEQGHRP